jgi:hypothetical protein
LENLTLLEQNFGEGKLQVRFKHWNGRVRVMVNLSFSILSPLSSSCFFFFFWGGGGAQPGGSCCPWLWSFKLP